MKMKFEKRALRVEAEQFLVGKTFPEGVILWDDFVPPDGSHGYIKTAEIGRPLHVFNGDWIITDDQGQKYACHPDVFSMNYKKGDECPKHLN